MRLRFSLLFFLLCAVISPAQHTVPMREQTNFGVEDDFEKPLLIPAAALNALQTSNDRGDMIQRCAEQEGIKTSDIPASWFAASEIRLSHAPASGLAVRGETRCLGGAHTGQFWVLEKTATGYRIIFHGRGDGFEVSPSRTNGYRDLKLTIVTQAGRYVDEVRFRYLNGKYSSAGHQVTHN